MNEIKEKIKDLELALNYVCYDADLIPKLQTVWQKLELLQEVVNKNDLLPDVSQRSEPFINFAEKVVKYYEEMDIGDYDLYKEAKKLINGG